MATPPAKKRVKNFHSEILAEFPKLTMASTKISFRQIRVDASRAISEKINAEVKKNKTVSDSKQKFKYH